MYLNESDMRRILLFLVDQLPRDNSEMKTSSFGKWVYVLLLLLSISTMITLHCTAKGKALVYRTTADLQSGKTLSTSTAFTSVAKNFNAISI